ncbi:MAG: GerAB/ArcD/ProY family transporter [Firmicutes bacterium]|nr:GerAB/ArcD/ProY family transporter [Bacillota bacterium]
MKALRDPISLGQFFFVAAVSVVAGGVYIWPETVLRDAGLNAPWSVLLSIGCALGLVWLSASWPSATQGETEFGRMREIWGPWRWPAFVAMLGLYVPLDSALMALFSHMLHQIFYPLTPRWVFMASIVLMVGWLASAPLAHIARNIQWWFPLILASFFLLAAMAMSHFHEGVAILPSAHIKLWPVAQGTVATWYLWMQGEVIVTVGGHVRNASWRQVRRWAVAAMGFQALVVMIIYVLVVGTLGPTVSSALEWPVIYIFSNLTVQTLFISRPSFFIIVAWVVALILYLTIHLFVLSVNLQDGFQTSESARRGIVWALSVVEWVLAQWWGTPLIATDVVVHLIDPAALVLTVGSTLLSVFLVALRRRRQGAKAPTPAG